MMEIGRRDVELLERLAVLQAAHLLSVEDADFRDSEDLLAEIRTRDPEGHARVDQFVRAYWAWFEFHERGENVTLQNHDHFVALVTNRDATREAFLEWRDQLVEAGRAQRRGKG